MGFSKIVLLYNTVKYLRFKQIYYRVYYYLRNKNGSSKRYTLTNKPPQINWKQNEILVPNSYSNNTFTFLNKSKGFKDKIDWNFSGYGKLWAYNLNYFDFLNQKEISKEEGASLIKRYIENDAILKDGKEPYPISLRGINWVKFLSKNKIKDVEIDEVLFNHFQLLCSNLEYHLLANHLLENVFSLLFGAYYFQDEKLYALASKILKEELEEQVLSDGGHFELSPMYHQILLHRLLDCISLLQQNDWKKDQLLHFLKEKANSMLSWLQTITYRNGEIPMVNDSAYNIAPTSNQLFSYARTLSLEWLTNSKLTDSGYRKFCNEAYELLLDVGDIKPTYQPGHTHSDTFSFELYNKETLLIVDTGISTYDKSNLRQKERSTSSHNTVQIGDLEQTEVWGGFRVGKRAKVDVLEETCSMVNATHDGYKKIGIKHNRKFEATANSVIISDSLSKPTKLTQKAYFHFHPDVKNISINNNSVSIDNNINIDFNGNLEIKLLKYQYALGFNKTTEAFKIVVYFNQTLETQIQL